MSDTTGPAGFGRVSEDGTVYVRTSEGERAVGQVPDVAPDEALAFYVRRFESLHDVDLLVPWSALDYVTGDVLRA